MVEFDLGADGMQLIHGLLPINAVAEINAHTLPIRAVPHPIRSNSA